MSERWRAEAERIAGGYGHADFEDALEAAILDLCAEVERRTREETRNGSPSPRLATDTQGQEWEIF